MDQPLEDLLRSILGTDPHGELDDKAREAVMRATLALSPEETFRAVWKFLASIRDDFTRSHWLQKLASQMAARLEFNLAEQIARSIPLAFAYWRFHALATTASELLRLQRRVPVTNYDWRDRAFRLIREIEKYIPELSDEDRPNIIWQLGLDLVKAGELNWAEQIAASDEYCPENTWVLLEAAKAHAALGQPDRAREIARRVAQLACCGNDFLSHRAFDLEDVGELIGGLGDLNEAVRHLQDATRLALEAQHTHDIDGSKCLLGVAITLAKLGQVGMAREAAEKITQPRRREDALRKIDELSPLH
jgi:tetratricopeptide (TPR) repeat protein